MKQKYCQKCGKLEQLHNLYDCQRCHRLCCLSCLDYRNPVRCRECGVQERADEVNEFGLFSKNGCVEGGFHSRVEAEKALKLFHTPEEGLEVLRCCPDHSDYALGKCERCEKGL